MQKKSHKICIFQKKQYLCALFCSRHSQPPDEKLASKSERRKREPPNFDGVEIL